MADQICCRPDGHGPVSIHTRKITDSCRDKDCIENLRVYLTQEGQELLENVSSVKARSAELLYADLDVEPTAFQQNRYSIDITFYYRIELTACGCGRPSTFYGLAVFSKRVVLCGEDSNAKIFTSEKHTGKLRAATHPTAVVEVLDPMILSTKVREVCDCNCDCSQPPMPSCLRELFDGDFVLSGERRKLYVCLGQFSIIRLERDAQIVVPTLASALPSKSCSDGTIRPEDPCEMFSHVEFPVTAFFPNGCNCHRPEPLCENTPEPEPKTCGCRKEPRDYPSGCDR